jgi:hypothetical protein
MLRYTTAAAFRQALEQRLHTHGQVSGVSLSRLRKSVAFDRLMARLIVVAPDHWMLKGALALEFRLGVRGRATKDADFVRHDDEAGATGDLLAAQALDLGDYFALSIERVILSDELPEGNAVRYRVRVELAGRLFEEVFVDVGFTDPLKWPPNRLAGTDLLNFAGIPRIEFPVVAIEQQVAEKVHAYTRRYAHDAPSSRPKDLVDLVLVQSHMHLDAGRLHEALQRIFEARGLQPLPVELPRPPADWRTAYGKLAVAVGIDPATGAGHAAAAAFLNPILGGRASGSWDPDLSEWLELG